MLIRQRYLYLLISGSGQRIAESYRGSAASAPMLVVKYCGNSNAPVSINVQISSGANDVEESGANGSMYSTSSDLELVHDTYQSKGNQKVGMRFENVAVPIGATITKAYVQFTTDENNNRPGGVTIRGEASANSAPFTSTPFNVSSRVKTSAFVAWMPPSWNVVGQSSTAQQTSDISSVVQEIVNTNGWTSGNALTLIVEGTGRRVAESYDGTPSAAPVLHVEYVPSL